MIIIIIIIIINMFIMFIMFILQNSSKKALTIIIYCKSHQKLLFEN